MEKKSKPIVKIGLTEDGTFVVMAVPCRWQTNVIYYQFEDVVKTFPLALFDIKVVYHPMLITYELPF